MDAGTGGGLRSMTVADNRLDREGVAEEIEDLGASQLSAVASHCRNIVAHLLKIEYSDLSDPQKHWRHEVRIARVEARTRITATIKRQVEASLPEIYADAKSQLRSFDEDRPGFLDALPSTCPYALDDILDRDRDWFPEPAPRPEKRPAARRSGKRST